MSSSAAQHAVAGEGPEPPAAGPSARATPDNDALLKPEQLLQEADTVLEKDEDVLAILKDYLRAGGRVQTAVSHLSDGYLGYASMAELMVEWADLVDMPLGSLLGPGAAGGSGGSLSRAYSTGGGSSSRNLLQGSTSTAAGGADGSGNGAAGQDGAQLDALLLQELIKERFDPTKFLSVFKKGHPTWLDQLIQHHHSRRMFYELSAANKNSLLLNYAIQCILKQGYEDEVAQVGGSLASYFDVYHRLLASRLSAAAQAHDAKQLRSIAREIASSSVDNQHTYVHAQLLLSALAQLPGGSVFRRLSQEVEAAAAERQGGIKVYQLQPLFVPRMVALLECRAVQLVSAVLMESAPNLPGAGAVSQEAAKQQLLPFVSEQLVAAEPHLVALQQLYQQESELSVQALRHPRMMQLLLSGMYLASDAKPSAMSQQTCSMRELCIRLLALAVAGRAQQGHLQLQPVQDGQQQQEQQEQGQRQEQGQQPDGQQRRSLSPEVRVYVGVEAVAERLRESLALAKRMANSKLLPKDLDSTSQVCRLPVAALGLLQHSQSILGDEAVYAEEKLVVVLPNHLSMLHRIACEQPGMIPKVLPVVRTALGSLGASHHELTKSVLTFLVSLILSGAVGPTLDLVKDWSKSADPSLLRHFVELVLESVEPPYSEGFSRALLQLMAISQFTRVERNFAHVLRVFATGCRDIPYRPPLANDLQSLLDHWAA